MIEIINGKSCMELMPQQWTPGKPPAKYLNVDCVYAVYGSHENLYWEILDTDGNTIDRCTQENPVIKGGDYLNWDRNDHSYPFKFVAAILKLIIK